MNRSPFRPVDKNLFRRAGVYQIGRCKFSFLAASKLQSVVNYQPHRQTTARALEMATSDWDNRSGSVFIESGRCSGDLLARLRTAGIVAVLGENAVARSSEVDYKIYACSQSREVFVVDSFGDLYSLE